MEPSDRPTEKQVYAIYQEYSAALYSAALNAKDAGAGIAAEAIEKLLDSKLVLESVKKIPTKQEMSVAIRKALKSPKNIHPLVMRQVQEFLAPYDFDVEAFLDE